MLAALKARATYIDFDVSGDFYMYGKLLGIMTNMNSSFFFLQSVYFKVRKLSPCIISGLQVNVELPEEDEIQISLFGMVLGQGAPPSHAPAFPQVNPTPTPVAPLSTHPEVPQKKAKQGVMIDNLCGLPYCELYFCMTWICISRININVAISKG